jgi:hypothetical protein
MIINSSIIDENKTNDTVANDENLTKDLVTSII